MIRKIALAIITIFLAISSASAVEMPDGHAKKTKALAENFIKHSRQGDYNKIYTSLRKIQKYQWKLEKEQIVQFYKDLHAAVQVECDRQGLSQDIKDSFKEVIDSMFSMKLREDLQTAASDETSQK